MPTTSLPENPSLEHLKGQAKLVRDLIRTADPGGLSMVDEFHPRFDAEDLDDGQRSGFKTADAQLIVARMYRFSTWNRLREHCAVVSAHSFTPLAERHSRTDQPASFVRDACLDYAEDGPSPTDRIAAAHRMLEADPTVASGSIEALAAVGDHQALAAQLDIHPDAINEPCGPNGWPPLLYAVYSRISTDNPDWSAIETVKLLLDRGADPNSGFLSRGLVPPFTALTGAFGGGESHQPWHTERLEIARLVLDAGADPNDGQLLYNNGIGGQNHDNPSYLELLVEYGLGAQQQGPWYERLGDQLRDPAELLYDELEAAAKRNRPTILSYLAALGLDLDRPVGRSQSTPARIAAAEGHGSILAILAQHGIDTAQTPIETALQHTRTNRTDELRQLLAEHPELLPQLRIEHSGLCKNVTAEHPDMLDLLIELGFDINDRTGTKTALHHAAEANDTNRARLLIDHGADPNLVDTYIGATPWGWANHFGNTETATFLHPLTHQGEALPEITVRYAQTTRTLATPEHIERLLDAIHQTATAPALVRLETKHASISLGLGRNDLSIALHLDTGNKAWHALGNADLASGKPIAFASPDHQHEYDFFPEAAVTLDTARAAARAFVLEPLEQPSAVTWISEGHAERDEN
ncbi:MAG: Imm1 family immunity protein [Acidimicrobiia bacterium]|nr:Imm1 family immunity protein [Acidimicrobiia bacterium]